MSAEIMSAELHCAHCDQETLHTLVYAGRLLVSSTCETCQTQVRHEPADLRIHYVRDLEHRIVTKPFRLWRRFWKSPRAVFWGFPKQAVGQPRKFWNEVKELFK